MKYLFTKQKVYSSLIIDIGELLEQGRRQAFHAVNTILVKTYWEIGKRIVEYEQKGNERAEYGDKLLIQLSKDLAFKYGKGFSRSNLVYMRLFYLKYTKSETLSHKLSWSHYFELLKINDELERSFYEKQCLLDNWSIRELKRQKNSALFHRLALCKDTKQIMKLSKKGNIIKKAEDLIKDPYILEFLKIEGNHNYSEKEFEQKIIDNLQMFLSELGKGFIFVGRQYRITLNNIHYYVDLVFYNRSLKCFVLIELKTGSITPQDVGQMNAYLNYFKREEKSDGENEPIGILLGTDNEKVIIEYALGGITNQVFVSKYKLYLPDKKELENKLREVLDNDKPKKDNRKD